MVQRGFTLFISGVAVTGAISSLIHDILLLGSFQSHVLNTITNFQFIFLFFLSILAIGLYHYWQAEKELYYLPRYFLVLFFVGFIGSIFLINSDPSFYMSMSLTVVSVIFALGLLGLGGYSLQRIFKRNVDVL